jgi:hypothetical protein
MSGGPVMRILNHGDHINFTYPHNLNHVFSSHQPYFGNCLALVGHLSPAFFALFPN